MPLTTDLLGALGLLLGLVLLAWRWRPSRAQAAGLLRLALVGALFGLLLLLAAVGWRGPVLLLLGAMAVLMSLVLHLLDAAVAGPSGSARLLRFGPDSGPAPQAGLVIGGYFTGRRLETMALEDLLALLGECERRNPEEMARLIAWLDRFWTGWDSALRGGFEREPVMTLAWARSLLGLTAAAGEAEIREAYLRRIRTAHPDHGGSAEQAMRLNAARDLLLAQGPRG